MPRSKTDFANDGRRCGRYLMAVLDRLADDGTVLAEDAKALEIWNRRKVRAWESQLLAEGATKSDCAAWRDGLRNEVALQTAKAT
jgi:hypothetical protein